MSKTMNAAPADASAIQPSRRDLLRGAAAASGGLLIGFHWSGTRKAFAADAPMAAAQDAAALAPNAFVRVSPDGWVTVIAKHVEMGQGSHTGLATILAEELDADWEKVGVQAAPADNKVYNNLFWGPTQGTGGSSSIANSFTQLRKAGAQARAVLVRAAAERWKVPEAEISVRDGVVSHAGTNQSAGFGELAEAASLLTPPDDPPLKDPKDFRLIGRRIKRVDTDAKTDGSAIFAMDFALPDMLVAVVARPPLFGGTVKTVDDADARAIPGVVGVVAIPRGVAVLASGMWPAMKGREALKITWDDSKAEKRGSAELTATYLELADKPGAPARREGDADAALSKAAKKLSATYTFPFLAHTPMEPLSCVARLVDGKLDIWAGCQFHTFDKINAAAAAGVDVSAVNITTLFAGGSFGRRANAESDYIAEAASIVKAMGDGRPVKLIWTREDDVRGGRYRPLYVHKLEAGLDDKGAISGWRHRIVGQSILSGSPFAAVMVKDGVDVTSVEGAANLPYTIPDMAVDLHTPEVGVPVLWWRSVGSTHTAFSTETFLDEVAAAAGKDPVALRRELLEPHPRHLGVLNLAVEKADWDKPLPEGWARGVAVHESFHTYVAQVAEVSRGADGAIRVERVVCAVDCGIPVNPDVIEAQMQGGIGFGLGAIMDEAITLTKGEVDQSNFDTYRPLRIDHMPKVEVHIVPSDQAPSGVGEPGVPPVGPAVANAIRALTGKTIHVLPISEALSA